MTRNTRTQNVLLGLFVAVGAAILVATLFALGTLREALTSRIDVQASFEDVGGLKRGDAVWYAGVPVGTVRDLGLDAHGVEATLAVESDASEWIPSDVTARISSDSLIGNKIVILEHGTPGGQALADGDRVESVAAVSPEQILAKFSETNENLLAITRDLRVVSSRLVDDEGSVARFLSDDALYTDVTEAVGGLKAASDNAAALTDDLAQFASALNQPGTLPHDIVNDRSTYGSLQESARQLESATTDVAKVAKRFEQDAIDPETPVGVLLHDRSAGGDLADTLAQLDTSTELFAENMEALQHNFLLRGYFKKKAKKEAKDAVSDEGGADDGEADAAAVEGDARDRYGR